MIPPSWTDPMHHGLTSQSFGKAVCLRTNRSVLPALDSRNCRGCLACARPPFYVKPIERPTYQHSHAFCDERKPCRHICVLLRRDARKVTRKPWIGRAAAQTQSLGRLSARRSLSAADPIVAPHAAARAA
jgi:hypothetical protein